MQILICILIIILNVDYSCNVFLPLTSFSFMLQWTLLQTNNIYILITNTVIKYLTQEFK
jgi:hypothetical protein